MTKLSGLSPNTSPVGADQLIMVQAAGPTDVKVTMTNFINALAPAWTSWTPTWTGLTVGNALQHSSYAQVGKIVICRLSLTWGSTTSAAGAWGTFTLPVTAQANSFTVHQALSYAYLEDAGVTGYHGFVSIQSGGGGATAAIQAFLANATYLSTGTISNTTPWAWGAGDFVSTSFVYEAA